MRKLMSWMAAMAAVATVSALLLAGPEASGQSARTYKIGVVVWQGWSPIHVAKAKGLWEKEGVKVEYVNFNTLDELTSAMRGKRLDLAFHMMGSVANMYQNGESVVILGETDWSHGGDKIIIKKDVTLASQKGKFIGIYANEPSVTFFVNKYLASQGLKLSDFKLAKMDPDVLSDQFIAGRLSMIVTFDPDALRAEREGNGKVVATSADYPGCLPEGIFGYRQVVEGIPAADLEKILLGWIRAVEWTKNPANWKEYQQILNQYTFAGSGPFSEADLKGMMAAVLIHDRATIQQRNQPGGGLSQYLNELKTFMSQNGLLKKEFTPAELLNTQPLLNALKK